MNIANVICYNTIPACSSQEDNGNIRLVDGQSIREGRLEICMNGRWGTVCDNGFDTANAAVACRQLGFYTSSKLIMLATCMQ